MKVNFIFENEKSYPVNLVTYKELLSIHQKTKDSIDDFLIYYEKITINNSLFFYKKEGLPLEFIIERTENKKEEILACFLLSLFLPFISPLYYLESKKEHNEIKNNTFIYNQYEHRNKIAKTFYIALLLNIPAIYLFNISLYFYPLFIILGCYLNYFKTPATSIRNLKCKPFKVVSAENLLPNINDPFFEQINSMNDKKITLSDKKIDNSNYLDKLM